MNQNNNSANDLRKEVKHKLIDLDLDREGSYDRILPPLSDAMGRPIAKSVLSMALSGYRTGKQYQDILAALKDMLSSWCNEQPPVCEYIHNDERLNKHMFS